MSETTTNNAAMNNTPISNIPTSNAATSNAATSNAAISGTIEPGTTPESAPREERSRITTWDTIKLPNAEHFHFVLPTFAGDYSGAASVLFDLGGTIIFHDPAGCTSNFVGYDEPRSYAHASRVFTSGLDDMQALFGKDEMLISAACKTQGRVRGDFVALVGSPNPMILGTDFKALARELEQKIDVPVIAFPTTGTRTYEHGAMLAYKQLATHIIFPRADALHANGSLPDTASEQRKRTVNLLGAIPLDVNQYHSIDVIKQGIEARGWKLGACWCMGSTLDDLAQSVYASCNIVLSYSALPLARLMKQRYGIPYVWAQCSGKQSFDQFMDVLTQHYEQNTLAALQPLCEEQSACMDHAQQSSSLKVLIIADQVVAHSMRCSLRSDFGITSCDSATFFSTDAEGMQKHDIGHICEKDAIDIVSSHRYDVIVSDGLLRPYCNKDAHFIEVPHLAVSGRLSWSKTQCPYGDSFSQEVSRVLEGSSRGRSK